MNDISKPCISCIATYVQHYFPFYILVSTQLTRPIPNIETPRHLHTQAGFHPCPCPGEYWVVGADIEQYDADAPEKYINGLLRDEADPRAVNGFRFYFGVVPTPPGGFYNFSLQVNAYMEQPPFNFPNPVDIVGGVKRVSNVHSRITYYQLS